MIGGQLVLSYLRDAASEMEIHGLDGKLVRKVALPPLGSATGMVGRAGEDVAYFGYSSFTEPNIVYRTSIRTGKVTEWARAHAADRLRRVSHRDHAEVQPDRRGVARHSHELGR